DLDGVAALLYLPAHTRNDFFDRAALRGEGECDVRLWRRNFQHLGPVRPAEGEHACGRAGAGKHDPAVGGAAGPFGNAEVELPAADAHRPGRPFEFDVTLLELERPAAQEHVVGAFRRGDPGRAVGEGLVTWWVLPCRAGVKRD